MLYILSLSTIALASDDLPQDTAEAIAMFRREPVAVRLTVAPKSPHDVFAAKYPLALVVEYAGEGVQSVYVGQIAPSAVELLSSSIFNVQEELWGEVVGERVELVTWETELQWNPGPGTWLVFGRPYRLATIGGYDYPQIDAPEIYSATAFQVPSRFLAFPVGDGSLRDVHGNLVCLEPSGNGPFFNDCADEGSLAVDDALDILRSIGNGGQQLTIPGLP